MRRAPEGRSVGRQRGYGTPWHSRLRSRRRESEGPKRSGAIGRQALEPRSGETPRAPQQPYPPEGCRGPRWQEPDVPALGRGTPNGLHRFGRGWVAEQCSYLSASPVTPAGGASSEGFCLRLDIDQSMSIDYVHGHEGKKRSRRLLQAALPFNHGRGGGHASACCRQQEG